MTEQVKKQNTYTSEFRESEVKLAIETVQPISLKPAPCFHRSKIISRSITVKLHFIK